MSTFKQLTKELEKLEQKTNEFEALIDALTNNKDIDFESLEISSEDDDWKDYEMQITETEIKFTR